MQEHFFTCPYCVEEISMLLDPSVENQKYVEDCEVCCNPVEITAGFRERELVFFQAEALEQ